MAPWSSIKFLFCCTQLWVRRCARAHLYCENGRNSARLPLNKPAQFGPASYWMQTQNHQQWRSLWSYTSPPFAALPVDGTKRFCITFTHEKAVLMWLSAGFVAGSARFLVAGWFSLMWQSVATSLSLESLDQEHVASLYRTSRKPIKLNNADLFQVRAKHSDHFSPVRCAMSVKWDCLKKTRMPRALSRAVSSPMLHEFSKV